MFSRVRSGAHTWPFVFGYLFVWTRYGLARIRGPPRDTGVGTVVPGLGRFGPWVAGGALAAAGLYQLTLLEAVCLRHCRSPLHFLLRGRPGRLGAVRNRRGS